MIYERSPRPIVLSIVACGLLTSAWSAVANVLHSNYLPTPGLVLRRLIEGFWNDPIIAASSGVTAGLGGHLLATASRCVLFMLVGAAVASISLFAATCCREIRMIMRALLPTANSLPPFLVLAIAHALGLRSIFVEFAGGSLFAAISLTAVGIAAIEKVPLQHLFLARAAGASRWWIGTRVYLRWIEAECLLSVKSIASISLGVTVVIEFLLAPNGIGRVLKFALSFNSADLLLAGLLALVAFGTLMELTLGFVVRRRLRWMMTHSI